MFYETKPNPFSNETVTEYSLFAIQNSTTINIYDLQGSEKLKIDLKPLANKLLVIDKSQLSGGIYYYVLVVDCKICDSKKLLVL